jgi:HD-GYP domain-containing protein (c-di-GMP phosphodiesterase class II)
MSSKTPWEGLARRDWRTLQPQRDVWEVLEGYARAVGHSETSVGLPQLAVTAVRDSIGADVVFWYPGTGRGSVQIFAGAALPGDWCAAFTKSLLARVPGVDGRLLLSHVPLPHEPAPVVPQSVALVRVSKTHASWLAALSLSADRRFDTSDLGIMSVVRQILVNHRRRCDLTGRMSETLAWLAQCLTSSIEAHVPHARGHCERVAKIAVEIGKHLHLPNVVLSDLYFAGLLHDIGITGVQQKVLLKPGRLTDEEFAEVKAYPLIGDNILAGIKQLAHLRLAVRHHHEQYDGRGYPDGLAGENIPLLARILAVSDAFDAMLSPRPHRPPLTSDCVESALVEGAGKRWDPTVIEQVLTHRPHLYALRETPGPGHAVAAVQRVVADWKVFTSRNMPVRAGPTPP